MKKVIFALALMFAFTINKANAQYVKVRPEFTIGVNVGPRGVAPHHGDIWVGPEWEWRNGRYVEMPGHWAAPRRYGAIWIPGHWKYTRRGYRWIAGHWK